MGTSRDGGLPASEEGEEAAERQVGRVPTDSWPLTGELGGREGGGQGTSTKAAGRGPEQREASGLEAVVEHGYARGWGAAKERNRGPLDSEQAWIAHDLRAALPSPPPHRPRTHVRPPSLAHSPRPRTCTGSTVSLTTHRTSKREMMGSVRSTFSEKVSEGS